MSEGVVGPQTFRLPEHLDLTAAAPLRAHLAALVGTPLILDASGVQKVGGLSLQVLLAAGIAWGESKQDIRVLNETRAFTDGLRHMGITDINAWFEGKAAA